jgi:hypothetical protein
MKIRNLAALLFRLLGVTFVIEGAGFLASAIGDRHSVGEICENIVFFILGFCCIRYSKKLAQLFCRGLDDDAA